MKIAKVALNNILVWTLAWTPYAAVALIGAFGHRQMITPLVSQIPSFACKFAAAFNPLTTTLAHPKVRNSISTKFPCLGLSLYDIEEDVEVEEHSRKSSVASPT